MQDGEALVAWVLFWVFAAITTISAFLITDHHRPRRQAILVAGVMLMFFVLLYSGLRALFGALGL